MTVATSTRPLAVVTGASSGIGLELARCCASDGFDLLVCSDEPAIHDVVTPLSATGAAVEALQADLATEAGVDALQSAIGGRPVAALLANAGRGLGHGFLDQDFVDIRKVIDTNLTGTLDLLHRIGRDMRDRGTGRILITGSIAGLMPGSFQAVYNGTKAFLDSFSFALRNELKDSGVTVSCLMPGATDTNFFERADMLDTQVGQARKDDPADVAKAGYDAMMKGEGDVVAGMKNKVLAALAHVTPSSMLAEQHRKMSEPGSAARPDRVLVISPHLDDAVFSCGRWLSAHPGATVVTVFAGTPTRVRPVTDWDARCGFADAGQATRIRRDEDRAALRGLVAEPLWLDFRDSQYGEPDTADAIAEALAPVVARCGRDGVLLPLGLFHSDHLLAHDAAWRAVSRGGVAGPVLAYEDAPYRGMPGVLQARLATLGLRATPAAVGPAGSLEAKRAAVAAYASQIALFGPHGLDSLWDAERFWRLDVDAAPA